MGQVTPVCIKRLQGAFPRPSFFRYDNHACASVAIRRGLYTNYDGSHGFATAYRHGRV